MCAVSLVFALFFLSTRFFVFFAQILPLHVTQLLTTLLFCCCCLDTVTVGVSLMLVGFALKIVCFK